MQLGDTFLMRTPGHSWDHLWIVISDPTKHAGTFIIVNLTTDAARTGTDCELNPGDHRWIIQKCYANFADALEITREKEANIVALVASKTITIHDPLDPIVLGRIVAAAKKSRAFPPTFRAYL